MQFISSQISDCYQQLFCLCVAYKLMKLVRSWFVFLLFCYKMYRKRSSPRASGNLVLLNSLYWQKLLSLSDIGSCGGQWHHRNEEASCSNQKHTQYHLLTLCAVSATSYVTCYTYAYTFQVHTVWIPSDKQCPQSLLVSDLNQTIHTVVNIPKNALSTSPWQM